MLREMDLKGQVSLNSTGNNSGDLPTIHQLTLLDLLIMIIMEMLLIFQELL